MRPWFDPGTNCHSQGCRSLLISITFASYLPPPLCLSPRMLPHHSITAALPTGARMGSPNRPRWKWLELQWPAHLHWADHADSHPVHVWGPDSCPGKNWHPCSRLLFMHGTGKQNDIPGSSCQSITEGSWQISILDIPCGNKHPTAHSSSFLKHPVLFSLPSLSHLISQIMCTQILILGWCPRDPKTLREENKFYVTSDSLITTITNPWGSDHTAPRFCPLCTTFPSLQALPFATGSGEYVTERGLGPEACSLRARQTGACRRVNVVLHSL